MRRIFAAGIAAAAVELPSAGALEYVLAPGPYTVENMGSPLSANNQEHQVMFRDVSGDLHLLVYYDVEDI